MKLRPVAERHIFRRDSNAHPLAVQIIRHPIRQIWKRHRPAAAPFHRLAQLRGVVQLKLRFPPKVRIADHMQHRVRERVQVLLEQFQAIALTVDDPERDQGPLEFRQATAEGPPVGAEKLVAPGRILPGRLRRELRQGLRGRLRDLRRGRLLLPGVPGPSRPTTGHRVFSGRGHAGPGKAAVPAAARRLAV